MLIKTRKTWELSENRATPEKVYLNRREFLQKMGFAGAGALTLLACGLSGNSNAESGQWKKVADSIPPVAPPYPVPRNDRFTGGRPMTPEEIAAAYNNFYEFTTDKDRVWRLVERFKTEPWKIEISGHVERKLTLDMDYLLQKMPLEERVYRHRCVEAWSMVVPWSGFAMKALIDLARPTSKAKYVRMLTFLRPGEAPGQRQSWYPWPYYEGLTMQEAVHELTFLATGIYGHALPKQHGAPLRLVVPWKYGFKSIKSIVSIEFVSKQPKTFWNDLAAHEYDFQANVNPTVPHPRWSQATERDIGTGERIPTQVYNGYGELVAPLYEG